MFKLFPATLTQDNRKIPLISGWLNQATTDSCQIKLWQEFYRGRLSFWGVPAGPKNDILVLDVDVKAKSNGFQTIQDLNLPIPNTMSQSTPSGGKHYIFKYPKDGYPYGNKVGFLPGLDVRSKGGWIAYYGTDNSPILEAPLWLTDMLKKNNQPSESDLSPVNLDPQTAIEMFQKCLEGLSEAPEGERNHTLNTEAFKVGQLLVSSTISKDYAIQELTRVALDIGLNASEIRTTLRSAFDGGTTKPMVCPFPDNAPTLNFEIPKLPDKPEDKERWTPRYLTKAELFNRSCLRKPQLFKDWSTEDIHITTADGGTGKTTMKLYEAVCLALGDRFLGFDCKQKGKTLFITGEDTVSKLAAMLGAILKQMGLLDDTPESNAKVDIIIENVIIKKDSDLCLISKDKTGFLVPNSEALTKLTEAVDDIKPKMIVFDPIASFWGSESALNDMNKAVVKLLQQLQERSQACVEMINHMGKVSSQTKDMTQFAGRGGTGLPSHSRVSRVLRGIDADEYMNMTGDELKEGDSAMVCNVGKFSDGSPLTNKPFVIVREGFLFHRKDVTEKKQREENDTTDDLNRIFTFIKEARLSKKYATKAVIVSFFMAHAEGISEARIKRALNLLEFNGLGNELLKQTVSPDETSREKVYIIVNHEGVEKYC